jgi:hypothetical protein
VPPFAVVVHKTAFGHGRDQQAAPPPLGAMAVLAVELRVEAVVAGPHVEVGLSGCCAAGPVHARRKPWQATEPAVLRSVSGRWRPAECATATRYSRARTERLSAAWGKSAWSRRRFRRHSPIAPSAHRAHGHSSRDLEAGLNRRVHSPAPAPRHPYSDAFGAP